MLFVIIFSPGLQIGDKVKFELKQANLEATRVQNWAWLTHPAVQILLIVWIFFYKLWIGLRNKTKFCELR